MSLLEDDPSFLLWNLDSNDLLFADGIPPLDPETPTVDFDINMDIEQWIINDLDRVNETAYLISNDQDSCEFVDVATDLKDSPDSFAGDLWTQSSCYLPEAAASLLSSTDCVITDEIQPASTNDSSVTATDWTSLSCLDFRDVFDFPENAHGGPPDSRHGNEASPDCVIAGRGQVESDSSLSPFLESPSRVLLPRDASRPGQSKARGSFRGGRKDHRKPRSCTRGVRSPESETRDILSYVERDALLYRKIPTNTRRKVKGPQVWQFLLRLLASPSSNSLVQWEDRAKKTFVLTEPELVARLWGFRNSKENFTYEKLSRAMRYHYHRGNLEAVLDHKFVYRFGPNVDIDQTI